MLVMTVNFAVSPEFAAFLVHALVFLSSALPATWARLCRCLNCNRLRLVEKQQKEQAYGHMNGVKIHNQWRRIMRMAKTEELKQDIEILSQSYDRNVDRKDALIQVCTSPEARMCCPGRHQANSQN